MAAPEDVELLIRLRMDFLAEEFGEIAPARREEIAVQLEDYFERHFADGSFFAFLAEQDNRAAGAVYLSISEVPAGPPFLNGKIGTVHNVLTYPQYRRQGVATKLMEALLAEAKKRGVASVRLSATQAGKQLYENMGFQRTTHPYMSLQLQDGE